jgi:hypothetical protein
LTSLVYVTITGQFLGGDETPLSGTATFTASQAVYSAGQEIVTPDVPVAAQITDGVLLAESGGALQLLATDNAGLTFLTLSGFFYWSVQVTAGGVTEPPWSFGLPSSPGTRDLFSLANMPFGGGSSGTVTSVSVASANGLAGTVANPASTPAITLRTTVTGLLKGNGTAISAATAGTDYAPATSGSAILKGNGSGGFSAASAGTDYLAPAGNGSQLTGITASQVSGAAPLASPALTGTPTSPTQTTGDNSTKIATDAFVGIAVAVEASRASTAEGILAAAITAETSRAETAEALALAKASNLSDLASRQTALDTLAGAVTSAQFLRGNGTHVAMGAIQASDVPTLNQSTSGNAATATNLAGGATVPAYVAPHVTALTDASSTLIDASAGNVFDWPLGAGSHTLAAPSNPVNGQMIKIRIAYSGSFTPLFNAIYHFGADGAPTWTATNAKVDEVAFEYNSNISAWCCQGWKLGF